MKGFEIILLDTVREFLLTLDQAIRNKIVYNLNKATISQDPEIFKKLTDEIWEFRTKYNREHYRLLAFWDKRDNKNTLVICVNGFVKKTKKTPKKEIEKAKAIMIDYFQN